MTTGRLTTTLSVLGLGFAVAGAGPVLAQNYTTAPQPAPTPPVATPTPGTPPPTTEQQGTMPTTPPSTEMQNQTYPTHHARRQYAPQSATAQNPAVERLNEQSLEAARHGQTFTPSGGQQ
jgi:hypothetical protein